MSLKNKTELLPSQMWMRLGVFAQRSSKTTFISLYIYETRRDLTS